jgi:hypothetical protein
VVTNSMTKYHYETPSVSEGEMSDKVIDIYEWRRPVKPGELPRGCVLVEPTPNEMSEQPRKIKPSEVALMVVSIALVSLLVANYV